MMPLMVASLNYLKIKKRIFKIPHPNYIGAYPENLTKVIDSCNSDSLMKCLFLGAIKPYKNIELIIESAKALHQKGYNIEYTIAGGGKEKYLSYLKNKTLNEQYIRFIGHFISDNEIAELIKSVDLLILPYDLKSSLNSGTCYLAFSYKKTVVCPLIGTIEEVGTENCYAYSYTNDEEHMTIFMKTLEKAYQDFKKDPNAFRKKGKYLYDKVKEENAPENIGIQYMQMYSSLLKM